MNSEHYLGGLISVNLSEDIFVHPLAVMEFLSTDNQEYPVDYLLSETCQDFTEELRLLMESHDALSQVSQVASSPNVYQSMNSETGSDSGVLSPGSEDERLCNVLNVQPSYFSSKSRHTPTVLSTNQSSYNEDIKPQTSFTCQAGIDIKSAQTDDQSGRNKKNAIAARLNRQKKKEYVQGLEAQVSSLQSENSQLKHLSSQMVESVSKLQLEVKYLKNVLANQSTLSKLLQHIPQIDEVKLSTSLVARKRSRTNGGEPDILCTSKKIKQDIAGVCLHVVNNTASLEFCASCSQRSTATLSV